MIFGGAMVTFSRWAAPEQCSFGIAKAPGSRPASRASICVRCRGHNASEVWAGGLTSLRRFDGARWHLEPAPKTPISALSHLPSGELLLVAENEIFRRQLPSGAWLSEGKQTTSYVYKVVSDGMLSALVNDYDVQLRENGTWRSVYSTSGAVAITGAWLSNRRGFFTAGTVLLRYDGAVVSPFASDYVPMKNTAALAGRTANEVYLAQDDRIYRFNGKTWSALPQAMLASGQGYRALYVTASGTLYAVGNKGLVHRFDGAKWTQLQSPTTRDLYGVWGNGQDIYIAGQAGKVWVLNTTSDHFSDQSPRTTTEPLFAIGGSGSNYQIAVGGASSNRGLIIERINGTWQAPIPTAGGMLCVWVESPREVWAGGWQSILMRKTVNWAPVSVPHSNLMIRAIGGLGAGEVLVASGQATIRYTGTSGTVLPSLRGFHQLWSDDLGHALLASAIDSRVISFGY
jgi:hypothetical protein